MQNKEVYVVVINSACDSEQTEDFELFERYEDAKAFFDKEVKSAKEDDFGAAFTNGELDDGYEQEESETAYEIWESGFYAANHINIYITTKKLN